MKFTILLGLGFACLATAAPPGKEEQLIVTKKFFPDNFVIYNGQHDIVDIVVPLNDINTDTETPFDDFDISKITIFFVEADLKDDGTKDYKGLYVYKNNEAKKVLGNGQCSTYAKDKIAYFGAKDGIYKYNEKDMTATKYGSVTESVIKMAVDTAHARVYYLTEDYVLYKYNEDELESSKVEEVKDVRDFVIDHEEGHMFYYDGNHQFYVYNGGKVQKIDGLPDKSTQVDIIRSPLTINAAYAVIDGRLWALGNNATSVKSPIKFVAKPTAYAPDTILVQYYAYKQKIYVYNLITLFNHRNIEDLSQFFEKNEVEINDLKTKKISSRL